MRRSGFDDVAAAGVGELFGGVDAACGDSHVLGEFDETLCGTKSRRSDALGPGVDPAEALPLDAHDVVGTVVVSDGW